MVHPQESIARNGWEDRQPREAAPVRRIRNIRSSMARRPSLGLSLAWLARILNPGSEHACDEPGAESSASLPGAKGLIFIPYLRGERTDASATASFRTLPMSTADRNSCAPFSRESASHCWIAWKEQWACGGTGPAVTVFGLRKTSSATRNHPPSLGRSRNPVALRCKNLRSRLWPAGRSPRSPLHQFGVWSSIGLVRLRSQNSLRRTIAIGQSLACNR